MSSASLSIPLGDSGQTYDVQTQIIPPRTSEMHSSISTSAATDTGAKNHNRSAPSLKLLHESLPLSLYIYIYMYNICDIQ